MHRGRESRKESRCLLGRLLDSKTDETMGSRGLMDGERDDYVEKCKSRHSGAHL